MKVFLGADHRGFFLKEKIKEWLKENGYEASDLGNTEFNPSDDYPDFSLPVAKEVSAGKGLGILFCGTGVGMNIAANKVKGVRAALVFNEGLAKQAREHGDSNILTLPADLLDEEKAITIVKTFLTTSFSGDERHKRRIAKIRKIELNGGR